MNKKNPIEFTNLSLDALDERSLCAVTGGVIKLVNVHISGVRELLDANRASDPVTNIVPWHLGDVSL